MCDMDSTDFNRCSVVERYWKNPEIDYLKISKITSGCASVRFMRNNLVINFSFKWNHLKPVSWETRITRIRFIVLKLHSRIIGFRSETLTDIGTVPKANTQNGKTINMPGNFRIDSTSRHDSFIWFKRFVVLYSRS